MNASPSVYLVLGTPGSGRRALLRDLIENGLPDEKVTLLLAENEAASPADARLGEVPNVTLQRWQWTGPEFPEMELPADGTVFVMADPLADVIDQIEAFKPWLQERGRELARVFMFVDCQLAEQQPVLGQWFDACIHFADVVFLTNRDGVANKWLSDFIQHYRSQFFPCYFIQVKKKGDLANPALVLDPTPRRVAQYFEEEQDFSDLVIETDDDEEEAEEGEDDGLPKPDPYFLRQRSGRRDKELPDVRNYLPKK